MTGKSDPLDEVFTCKIEMTEATKIRIIRECEELQLDDNKFFFGKSAA